MEKHKLSSKEKQEFTEYMLDNGELEKAVSRWQKSSGSGEDLFEIMNALARRAGEYGGVILSVRCSEIPTGADHVEYFMADKACEICWAEDKDGQRHAMVFTSKERFKECNDTSGVVIFLDDLFALVENKKGLDGIIINLGREEVILDKFILRGAVWLMKKRKEATTEVPGKDTEA